MSEQPTPDVGTEPTAPEGNLAEEFSNLGKNLIGILRGAWERPERQKLQQEIEGGLADIGNSLRKEAKAVADSPVTQKVKTEVEDLSNKVRSGQVEAKVRTEIVGALHIVNAELQKVADILSASAKEAGEVEDAATEGEAVEVEAAATEGEAVEVKAATTPEAEAPNEAAAAEASAGDAANADTPEAPAADATTNDEGG